MGGPLRKVRESADLALGRQERAGSKAKFNSSHTSSFRPTKWYAFLAPCTFVLWKAVGASHTHPLQVNCGNGRTSVGV